VFSLLCFIVCICSPLGIFLFLKHNRANLESLAPRFGSIYESLMRNSLFSLNFQTWFLLRRLLFALTTIYLASCPFLQVTLLMLQSFLSLCYLIVYQPFDKWILNKVELFNEGTLYMVCYPVLMFLLGSEGDNYDLGWLLIGLIVVNIGINVFIMVFVTSIRLR